MLYDKTKTLVQNIEAGGGPAFPSSFILSGERATYTGMKLRDYFAAQCPESEIPNGMGADAAIRARARYAWADAMIKVREEG